MKLTDTPFPLKNLAVRRTANPYVINVGVSNLFSWWLKQTQATRVYSVCIDKRLSKINLVLLALPFLLFGIYLSQPSPTLVKINAPKPSR